MDNDTLFKLIKANEDIQNTLMIELKKVDWYVVAINGFKYKAILMYHELHKVSISEAKKEVELYLINNKNI